MIPNIIIRSAKTAGELLVADQGQTIKRMISIGSRGDPAPYGTSKAEKVLRLEFDDIIFADHQIKQPPTEMHVQQIIDFAKALRDENYTDTLLIHCHAGISRSTAAAYICYATWFGAGREAKALVATYERRSIACPNALMVEIADRLLGRAGRLYSVFEDHQDAEALEYPVLRELAMQEDLAQKQNP